MAQSDVYRIIGGNRRAAPYVVAVQSARFDRLPTRVVIPFVPSRQDGGMADDNLAPSFRIDGIDVTLAPWQIFTIPVTALGPVVASLAEDNASARIIRGLDELISQAYG